MVAIKELITSPVFWFASVIVAFFMSFFASFAKDWTERFIKSKSIKKIEAAKARQKNFELKVDKLKDNPALISIYQNNIVYQKMRQVLYYTVTLVFMALSLNSAASFNFFAAAITGVFGLFIFLTKGKSVSGDLYELIAVINEVLPDDEFHFKG